MPFSQLKGTTFEAMFRPDEVGDLLLSHDAVMLHWTCLSQSVLDICRKSNIVICCYTHKSQFELKYIERFDGIDYVVSDSIDYVVPDLP